MSRMMLPLCNNLSLYHHFFFNPSMQKNNSHGCEGGDPTAAYSWILQNGIPDDTCTNYLAADQQCVAENICKNCQPSGSCSAVTKFTKVLIYSLMSMNTSLL